MTRGLYNKNSKSVKPSRVRYCYKLGLHSGSDVNCAQLGTDNITVVLQIATTC